MGNTFATAVSCMDGRVQIPVIEYIRNEYGVDYVDMVTERGPNKILSENEDKVLIESIKTRVAISVEKHNSTLIAIVGHYDCAGNSTDKETQLKQITVAINTIRSWRFNTEVIGLWVNESWHVEKIGEV